MIKKIVLAGGCFWGLEDLIRKQLGVIDTTVGYTGGKVINPTYHNHEGHAEAVEIEYDTEKTSYLEPLGKFYPAEEYHQDYLEKNPGGYTCHAIYFDSYLK